MIPIHPHNHQAHYDNEGNIILPFEGDMVPDVASEPQYSEVSLSDEKEGEVIVRESRVKNDSIDTMSNQVWKSMSSQMTKKSKRIWKEGLAQYEWSFASATHTLRRAPGVIKKSIRDLSSFLVQPVVILRKDKKPKEHSRAGLFVLDVFRFGGTFSILFLGLFITLNYQSFWQITTAKLNPIEHARAINESKNPSDSSLAEKLLRSPALAVAGAEKGDLLSYLPSVGPPQNRIVIPKLGLNVPLVSPPLDAVLEENWSRVEEDIQGALQNGVVHYPGTARPGQAGNFFVTGHSSYYPWAQGNYKTVFARLHELDPGDEYWVYHGGDKHRYIVRSKKEVKPSDVSVLDQPLDSRIGTLMTCTPVGTTLRRLILVSEEVDPETGIALKVGEQKKRVQKKSKPAMLPI